MWAVVATCWHCFFVNENLIVMAKGCNALGGSFRGRVGAKTFYVRRGQQIVYERSGKSRSTARLAQFYFPSAQRLAAKQWHNHLMGIGYVVPITDLELIANAGWDTSKDGETRVVFDEPSGVWGFDRLVGFEPWPIVTRNLNDPKSSVVNVSLRYESYNDDFYAIDAGEVSYHDVAGVSFVGSVKTNEIALHVSEPVVSNKRGKWGSTARNPLLLRFADLRTTPALWLGPQFSPTPVPYRLTDVRLSEVVGGQYTVRVWMWVKRDGTILHTFVYAAS